MLKNPYITRKLEKTILKYLKASEIIAVVGPRQCGKTTLLEHIFTQLQANGQKAIFLTFEDKKVLDLFTSDIDEFIELYIKPFKYVFIDEFHYAKKDGKLLKYIFDTTKRKIFVSGSSAVDLALQAAKYLVGRVFVFSLFPLDFEEFLSFRDKTVFSLWQKHKVSLENGAPSKPLSAITAERLKKCYQEYIIYGGYPRVILTPDIEEKKVVLKNIYNIYFLREVKDILGMADDYKLSQMMKALALQIGGLIEYQEIARVSELSYQTVKIYLNFLQKTFIAVFVKPYFRNKRTEIVKNPKVYFYDTGLRNYVVNDFRLVDERPDGGALLENALVMQLVKQELTFNFWRTKQQAEVDFVVDLPQNKKMAIEVKKSIRAADFSTKAVREFKAKYADIPFQFCVFDYPGPVKDLIFLPLV